MLPPAALVFDLDGTLIDSRRDITTAVNRMRAEEGLPPLALEQVVAMVGEGARVLVERALGGQAPAARLEPALGRYLAHYRAVCLDTTRPYPGVAPLLAELAARFPLAVLSNKGEALSRHILAGLGLDRFFREIVGGDSLPTRKPDPAGLRRVAARRRGRAAAAGRRQPGRRRDGARRRLPVRRRRMGLPAAGRGRRHRGRPLRRRPRPPRRAAPRPRPGEPVKASGRWASPTVGSA
jgi:phosphoglycolate phosphatase